MFDVVIPTYNNLDELKNCLEGFESQTFKDFKVFVCVDGSTDGTLEFLESANYSFEMQFLTHENNSHKGRNETRNLAMESLKNEYLLLFDSDIIPENNLLEKHFNLLREKDCISVGEIIYDNANENIWAKYLQTRGKGKFGDLREMPAFYLNTQNVALRTKYYIDSGGQDREISKSYGGDDTELGYRLGKLYGLSAIFNKSAAGHSIMVKSLSKALQQMEEFGGRNLGLIRKLNPEFREVFNFNFIEDKSLSKVLFRFLLREDIADLLKTAVNFAPGFLTIRFVHFLVFYSIYKGYSSGIKNDR